MGEYQVLWAGTPKSEWWWPEPKRHSTLEEAQKHAERLVREHRFVTRIVRVTPTGREVVNG